MEKTVTEENKGPLAGIKVIELGTLIAGPFCARMLGEFGAEVIKIESPDGGDQLRQSCLTHLAFWRFTIANFPSSCFNDWCGENLILRNGTSVLAMPICCAFRKRKRAASHWHAAP